MDCRVKLWEVYKERRCVRTYFGHRQAVKDVGFNNDGTQFLSAAYDRYIKLWDTETGDVVHRFTSKKIPFCVKFHPDRSKQHLFVAGTSDKKIICVSWIFFWIYFDEAFYVHGKKYTFLEMLVLLHLELNIFNE